MAEAALLAPILDVEADISVYPARAASPVSLRLSPGKIVGLEGPAGYGLTRLGLSLLAEPSKVGMVVAIDVRGWLSPLAAWEVGVNARRLVVVRCAERRLWPQVTAAVLEGVAAVYAEIPVGVGEKELQRLAALTRARRTGLALRPLRGGLPGGITHMRVRGLGVDWEGPEQGHGRLGGRRLSIEVSGKSMPLREVQLEDQAPSKSVLKEMPGVWRLASGV
ncbi:MAG: hypothetical protein ACRDWH_05415 [Acidimicrobiia bacterium]